MIKVAVFDIGGVLIDWDDSHIFTDIKETLGITEKALSFAWDKSIHEFRKGKITEDEFWARFCKDAQVEKEMPTESFFLREFKKRFHPNPEVFEIVSTLKKQGYVLAILSDTSDPHVTFMKSQNIFEMFEIFVFSNEVGYEKPEKEIYEVLIKKCHAKPYEMLFIDNVKTNADAATKEGIHGIHYTDPVTLKQDLLKVGIVV